MDILLSVYGKTLSSSHGLPRYDRLEIVIEKGQVLYFDKSKSTALSDRIRTQLSNDSRGKCFYCRHYSKNDFKLKTESI